MAAYVTLSPVDAIMTDGSDPMLPAAAQIVEMGQTAS